MNETFIRTVPPRAKGYGAIGLLLGLVVTVAFVFAWRAGLPEVRRANLKDYAKSELSRASKDAQHGRHSPDHGEQERIHPRCSTAKDLWRRIAFVVG